jgi:hypothetical protein
MAMRVNAPPGRAVRQVHALCRLNVRGGAMHVCETCGGVLGDAVQCEGDYIKNAATLPTHWQLPKLSAHGQRCCQSQDMEMPSCKVPS